MSTGSIGIGIRLDKGATATVEERDDDVVTVWLDGVSSVALITRMVADQLAPGRGFDIHIVNDLPVSQGFGMSAAGALAAGLCIAELEGRTRNDVFIAAHKAEVVGGGGLGDVAAIVAGGDVPVRTVPGLPPFGRVENAGFRLPRITLAVIGGEMRTDAVLGNSEAVARIRAAATDSMRLFSEDPTPERLFEASNMFSEASGLEDPRVSAAMDAVRARGYRAGMCMLGNSIFTDAPEREVWAALGRGRARTFACSSGRRELVVRRHDVARTA